VKLSFSTLGCPEWSFSEIVSAAKDFGYDGIEVRGIKRVMDIPRIPQFSSEQAPETRKILQKKNLDIVCMTSACCLNVPDGANDTVYEARAYIDTAKMMGVRFVRVLGDFSPEPKLPVDESHACNMLCEISEYAQSQGVSILIETNGYFAKTDRLRKLCEKAGNGVGVIWDINHPYRFFGETPRQTVETLGDLIKHVHVKDSKIVDGNLTYKIMGYGDMPVEECIKALQDIHYDGSYCLEWVKRWDMTLEEPGLAFAQYVSYMNMFKES